MPQSMKKSSRSRSLKKSNSISKRSRSRKRNPSLLKKSRSPSARKTQSQNGLRTTPQVKPHQKHATPVTTQKKRETQQHATPLITKIQERGTPLTTLWKTIQQKKQRKNEGKTKKEIYQGKRRLSIDKFISPEKRDVCENIQQQTSIYTLLLFFSASGGVSSSKSSFQFFPIMTIGST